MNEKKIIKKLQEHPEGEAEIKTHLILTLMEWMDKMHLCFKQIFVFLF